MRDQLVRFIRRYGDEALAVALTALVLLEVLLSDAPEWERLANVALAVVLGLAAARRSRAPLLLLGLMVCLSVASVPFPQLRGGPVDAFGLFLLLAAYSAGAHTSGRGAAVAGGLLLIQYVATVAYDPAGITADGLVFGALLFGAPWMLGRAVRQRRLDDVRLEQEKALAATAIAEERARIARELHDVVAHSISVMVLQARGGRRVLSAEPADARDAFVNIEQTGQQALEEMRRLVGLLRRSDEALALAPQPSLAELGPLIEQVRAAGLPVELVVEGDPRELPPGVDLSAFRIVQEALTNALRHAGPAQARVLLRYLPDDLEVEITDNGSGATDRSGFGYGLIGMRERVSVYGGVFQAGKQPGGGYALRVRLPLASAHG